MGISIDKLQFDPSAPSDNQRVGSFLIGAGGTVISSTSSSLDVNITNTVTVSATQLDIDDLDFSVDSVTAHQGGTWIIDSITNAVTVTATQLDIDDLDYSSDNVAIKGATGNQLVVNADGSINVNADISVVNGHEKLEDAAHSSGDVGSYMLNVRSDIPSAATSANGDYASFLSDNKGRLWVNDAANAGQSYGALAVGNTAAEYLGSPLLGRKILLLQNLGNKEVYIGFDASVTSSNGIQLAKHSSIELPFGDNLDVFMISASGTSDVRYFQLA